MLAQRLDHTLTSLEGLKRYHGHFLNWYDTSTRTPLHPRYVSTVDSGNLAASLMALAQALRALTMDPQTRLQLLDGLADTADVLARASSANRNGDTRTRQTMTEVHRLAQQIVSGARGAVAAGETAAGLEPLTRALRDASDELNRQEPSKAASSDVLFWCRAVVDAGVAAGEGRGVSDATLHALARRASTLADAMHFGLLYDHRRRMFSIGYRLADAEGPGRLDASFYDLPPPKRVWRASLRSPRATFRSTTGFTSDVG